MSAPGVSPIVAMLRARRLALGLTQGAVAARLRIAENHLHLLEHGRHSPRLGLVESWAATLGLEIASRDLPQTSSAVSTAAEMPSLGVSSLT